MNRPNCMTLTILATLLFLGSAARPDQPYDLVIKGGRIVDGTGAPWYVADVAVDEEKIVRIGRIDAKLARRVVDAAGLIVAPGFVDMMGQTASPMLENPNTAMNLLTQGITTINAGEGASAAPLSSKEEATAGYTTMAEYFQLLNLKGLPVNVVQTVGHTQVRRIVMGEIDRRPTPTELEKMQALVHEAMQAGAIGVSTALIYPPAVYATTDEIAALVKVAGQYGGGYYTHMRNEGDLLLEAVNEALTIGRTAGAPVHIFHLKAAGKQNWGKMQLAIAKIKQARAEGRQVTADIYPYINNGLGIAALIHPRHFAKGRRSLLERLDDPELRTEIKREMETTDGWENWYRHVGRDWNKVVIGQAGGKRYEKLVGRSLAAIAKAQNSDPWDVFFDLVKVGAFALPQSMTDANKILAMQQPFVSFCTDVGPANGRNDSHPRSHGAFPRLLSHYVRDLGAITLEQAVSQASAVAVNDVLVYDRGKIAEGLAADLIVFDYDALTDRATFANPHGLSEGMRYVVVNGTLVLDKGKFTGKRPGRVLRGPGYDPATAPFNVSKGPDDKRLSVVDNYMTDYMKDYGIPGAAVVVSRNGKIVHSRGYGYADVATRMPVAPDSLFRIASISKPITAVAVMQLVEKGKLKLDDKVFEILDDKPREGQSFDERQRNITIRHLLEHRGGWDRGKSFDAMFQAVRFADEIGVKPPANQDAVIQAMMGVPLDFDPGERYAYSNYGYCLAGRVIEKLTQASYADYVQEHVLKPLGIQSMRIGRTRLDGRTKNEVRYYDPGFGPSVFSEDLGRRVPHAYGAWNLEAMDSHGAWLASAEDLARFALALEDPDSCPILSADSVCEMVKRPPGLAGHDEKGQPKSQYYGLGWSVTVSDDGQLTAAHGGSLPGTNTILMRLPNKLNLVVLFNCRVSPKSKRVTSRVSQELPGLLRRLVK